MTTKSRSLRNFRNPIGCLILLAALGAAAGCSTAESPSGSGTNMNHVLPSGSSEPGWLVLPSGGSHTSTATLDYIANGGSSGCTQCHGSDLSGGISRVSCFGNPAGCHHGPLPDWVQEQAPGEQFPQGHGISAKKAPGSSGFVSCRICHAVDFSGGGANVSCTNTDADCHGVGVRSPHPAKPWRGFLGGKTHVDTARENAPVCAQCHSPGSVNNPANHPATAAAPGTPPGCFNNTLCHGENPVSHPVPFNDNTHYDVVTATFGAACSDCHDVSAPSTKVGPVCQTCHIAGSPLTALSCTSCHANPPDGATTAYPNVAGAHVTHIALTSTETPITCDTCHNGLGPSLLNLNHYNRAKSQVAPGDVLFLATYYAKSGASTFNNSASLNCSNVSCHGGQTTPNWQTGTIGVNFQCENCHVLGTTQYNSYNSGQHSFHISEFTATASTCVLCHNTTALALNHFTTLADNTISPTVAAATVGGAGTAITTWTPGTGTSGTCNAVCHPGNRTW
ncbi:CxxxxCH/CxxCH domain c-type cytochrome [Candidatus Deferrimicrobium sp.]|uniref:CxxxxCH/CxxCH domain c-type cytochrome n=1 Tax=Candidatus Deferrimicrobium sp. TaxID=3060586 RepID=UPI002ED39B49